MVWFDPTPIGPDLGPRPPPPPLPKYDIEAEAPKWDWYRLRKNRPKPWRHPDTPEVGGVPDSDDKPDWRGVIKNNIQPVDLPTPYTYGAKQIKGYFWFDTPDYADPFKKLWYSFTFFAKVAGVWASTVALATPPAKLSYGKLFFRTYVPLVATAMIGSTAVITVANLRGQKDDMYNYAAGGLAAAAFSGRNNYIKHFKHSIILTSLACFFKYEAEINGTLAIRIPVGKANLGLSAYSGKGGIETGNLQMVQLTHGDPGRDVRRFAL